VYLVVPSQSSALPVPVRAVSRLYPRTHASEQSSGTFKTNLGLRRACLKVNIADRTGRLRLVFTMAYCLGMILEFRGKRKKLGQI